MKKKPEQVVSEWSRINIDIITIPDRLRALREDGIAELVASFGEVGQLNPITVRPKGAGYVLIAGHRRLEAAKRCGWKSIHCIVKRDLDADKAEIAEIDENLMRAELTPAERALHIERRKKLYEKAHPETKHGGAGRGRGKSRQVGDSNERFTKDTADKTGQSERSVQRDAARGENVAVLPDIVGTSLDHGAELDALAKLPEHEQRELADRAKAGEEVTAQPDHHHRQKDGRIDRCLKRFEMTISSMCVVAKVDVHEIKFPPNLTREMAAEAVTKIDVAIAELVKLKARLATYATGDGDKASSIKKARITSNDVNTEASADAHRAYYSATDKASVTADPTKDGISLFLQTQNQNRNAS